MRWILLLCALAPACGGGVVGPSADVNQGTPGVVNVVTMPAPVAVEPLEPTDPREPVDPLPCGTVEAFVYCLDPSHGCVCPAVDPLPPGVP